MNNKKAWEYALGMNRINGLVPSQEYLELIKKEQRGELTTDDIRKILEQIYRAKGSD